MLLPPPFRDLLDRRDDSAKIDATLGERRNIALGGEMGMGKSALLSYVGNLDQTARFHDGVVYLQAAAQGENDLTQALHEAFYDVPPGVRPSAVEIRRNLADKCALVLLDDVGLPPASLGSISAYGPESAWVYASEVVAASAQRRPVVLQGLPTDDGLTLFERTLSRPLAADERAVVTQIVDAVRGHPARIEQAAGTAAAHGIATALAEVGKPPNVDDENAQSRRVLAALACGGSVSLEAEQCAAIAGVSDVRGVLEDLVRRGLVQSVAPGFRLASGLAAQVEATPEYAACRDRATAAFTRFAFENRGTPRSVARLAAPMTANMAWAAQNGRSADALRLARAIDGPLAEANRWDAWHDVLTRAYDIARHAGDMSNAAWALHQQGTRSALLDDKPEARRLLREARAARKSIGDTAGLKVTGANLKVLGWARWMILGAIVAGLGVTTLGASVAYYIGKKPTIALVPTGLDFEAQDVRAAPQQLALRIDNKGFGAVDVNDVTLSGDTQAFTVGNSCDGLRIPRTLACRLLVQFKPEAAGTHDATIAIRVRDVAAPLLVPVRGVATATSKAEVSPQSVDFGAVDIGGGSEDRRVTLHNAGSAPLTTSAIAIEGDGDFQIVREDCKASAIAPDAQCAIDLRLTPTAAAARRATLLIRDDASGSPRSIALVGEGHATLRLDVRPGNLDFGKQEIGTRSATQPVRLRNTGNVPLDVRQLTLDGSKAFGMEGGCANLAPRSECVVDVRFAPSAVEASSGRLVITTGAGERSVALSGNGIGRPAIEVTPGQLDFGAVKHGAEIRKQRVQITSVGSAALLLRAPVIEGDGRFSQTSGCPERLAPKAQCFVDVGFENAGEGAARARLIIAHDAAGGPARVTLSADVEATSPPVIERFDSSAQMLQEPSNVRLCFRVRNASQLRITGSPPPPSNSDGCVNRFVNATTTFTLTAIGEDGPLQQATATLTVAMAVPPPSPPPPGKQPPPPPPPPGLPNPVIVRLEAVPVQMKGPGETRLCFVARDAEQVLVDHQGAQPQSAAEGCVVRAVPTTTTFTVTARRGALSDQRSVTVVVPAAPPPPLAIVEFHADPPRLPAPGGSTTLCFTARNAERVVIQPDGSQPSSPNGGCVRRSIAKTTSFTLMVSRQGAAAQQAMTSVTVYPRAEPGGPVATGPLGGPAKATVPEDGGVITKSSGVKEATQLLGYCCQSGNVSRTQRSQCGGAWSTVPPTNCSPPIKLN